MVVWCGDMLCCVDVCWYSDDGGVLMCAGVVMVVVWCVVVYQYCDGDGVVC